MPAPMPIDAATPVLVTGGAGFVGSHLCEELLARGHRVTALDDLSMGSADNVAHLLAEPGFALVVGNAADPAMVARLVREHGAVCHLAGAVGVQWLASAPATVIERNLRCTEVVLAAAAAARTPTLFTSSSEVYGDGPVPFCEDAPVRLGTPDNPRGGYACAKAMGEWLCHSHRLQHGLPAIVVRLFNTVGPRQHARAGMVLPRFLAQARAGEPITVYGDGRQTRCFMHVRDAVVALADLLALPGAYGQIVNVGTDREVAVADLAELVRSACGSRSVIRRVPLGEVFPRGFVEPARRVPALARLRVLLGRVPGTTIERIVAELAPARALAQ